MAQIEKLGGSFITLLCFYLILTLECLNVVTGTSDNLLRFLISFLIFLTANQQLIFSY